MLLGKGFSASADQQDMGAVFHDCASGAQGAFDVADAGYSAGFQRRTVHHCSVEFVCRIMGEHRAVSSIEERAVFKHVDRQTHRIECAAAIGQYFLGGTQNRVERSVVGGFLLCADDVATERAGATVNGNQGNGLV